MSSRTCALIATLALMMVALPASADVLFGHDREILAATSQNSYRLWKIEDTTTGESRVVRQAASRLSSTFVLGENVDLLLYTSGGFSQERAVQNIDLSGLADVKLKGYWHVWQRRLVLGMGFNLPTGRTHLNEDEVRVATLIAPNVLGFRLRNYGSGLDLDLGMAVGGSLGGSVTVGGGISGLVRGSYDLDEVSKYRPGNELALTAGIDARRQSLAGTLDLVYRIFGADQVDGTDSFQEGDQLEITAVAALRGERWGADATLKDVVKADNQFLTTLPPGLDNRVANGNNLWLDLAPRYQPVDRWVMKALFDVVLVAQSQQQDTSASAYGLGIGSEVRLTPEAIADLRLTRLWGGSQDNTLDLSGWDTTLALRWQY
jgi:hypothetical protein